MDELGSKLTEKVGPLPLWQWGAFGAVAFVVIQRLRAGNSTSSGVSTVTLQPNAAGAVTPANPTDTGSLSTFLSGLGEQFPQFSFTLPDGTTFSGYGGIPINPQPPPTQPPPKQPPPIDPRHIIIDPHGPPKPLPPPQPGPPQPGPTRGGPPPIILPPPIIPSGRGGSGGGIGPRITPPSTGTNPFPPIPGRRGALNVFLR